MSIKKWVKGSKFFHQLRPYLFIIKPFNINKLRLSFIRYRFKSIGDFVYIDFPVKIKGKYNIEIGNDVVINSFVHIWGHGGVKIGDRVMIAAHTSITSLTHDYSMYELKYKSYIQKKVVIEDDVWIGSNVVIMPGIVIGKKFSYWSWECGNKKMFLRVKFG